MSPFARWLKKWIGPAHPSFRFRPRVELLEERAVPAFAPLAGIGGGFTPLGDNLSPPPAPFAQIFTADVNGDAKLDLIGFNANGAWDVSLNTGGGTFGGRTQWLAADKWSPDFVWAKLFVTDVTGDGKADIVGFAFNGTWWVGKSDGTKFDLGATPAPWATWSASQYWGDVFVADVTGDGKGDAVGFSITGDWFVGKSDGATKFDTGAAWATWSVASSWSDVFLADVTGDGKPDAVGFGFNGSWFVGKSDGATKFDTGAPWATWSIPASWGRLFVRDVNADGKADIVGFGTNGLWFVGKSDGATKFDTPAKEATTPWATAPTWSALFVEDFNTATAGADLLGFAVNRTWWLGDNKGAAVEFTTGAAPVLLW
jgi:hypothetical protein